MCLAILRGKDKHAHAQEFFAMRTGKATGCLVLLATGCLDQWDWMVPVASSGARAKFICFDGVARGVFYLGYHFQTCSLAPFFFCWRCSA